jgi:hypothetical protein
VAGALARVLIEDTRPMRDVVAELRCEPTQAQASLGELARECDV